MFFIYSLILIIISIIGYTLLATTKYVRIVFLLIAIRLIYWLFLMAELSWEINNSKTNNVFIDDLSFYSKYPWRHRILFDVIPVILTLIPIVLYVMSKEKYDVSMSANEKIRRNNVLRRQAI